MDYYSTQVLGKKEKTIQIGDFIQIKRIVSLLSIKSIYYYNIDYFTTEEDLLSGKPENLIQNPRDSIITFHDKIMFSIRNRAKQQIIQMNISNIFNGNINELCYIPIFKNVLFEKANGKYLSAYFIVLNLKKEKNESGIIKLIF